MAAVLEVMVSTVPGLEEEAEVDGFQDAPWERRSRLEESCGLASRETLGRLAVQS